MFKWGIIAPGSISKKFAATVADVQGAEVLAVASRSIERANSFADEYGIKRRYGSYEEIVKDKDLDAVYIATPHPYHLSAAKLALENKIPVLCEKPLTVNAEEAKEMVRIAKENNVFLMEAMWTRFLPAIRKAKEWVDAGLIGDIRMLKADFCFRADYNPKTRLFAKELGGGALLDIGVYSLSFASYFHNGKKPLEVKSVAEILGTGADGQCTTVLRYDDESQDALMNAVRTSMPNDAMVVGTKGYIKIPSFFTAESIEMVVNGEQTQTYTHPHKSSGFEYEILEVMECVEKGLLESPKLTLEESISIMETLDEVVKSW